jgi:threonylcarbamoyladenosine tRNA methylthiotransferase MtaB
VKYAVVTFGCRVNQADTLALEADLQSAGATPAQVEAAELVVVNTCSVTATADQGARQTIRRVARTSPSARIVVTGCYASRDPESVRLLPNVVRIVPNADKSRLVALIAEEAGMTTAERFGGGDGACGAPLAPGLSGRTALTLRVQTGCAESCAYCIIPATRGAPRSVPIGEVLDRVARAADAGFREIVLAGVHLGSYGRDLNPPVRLLDLLVALVSGSRGDILFRVSSLEPMDCPPEVVDLVAGSPALAPHFHLPLQHASDRMLGAMRRPYTLDRFAALVERIRARVPAASIGSDVIVGFPGERDEDFARLTAYLPASPLTHLHVFPYSDRPGTEASRLGHRVAGSIVRARSRAIQQIGADLAARFHASQVGAVRRALTIADGSCVVTDNYLKLGIPVPLPRNRWVQVRVLGAANAAVVA